MSITFDHKINSEAFAKLRNAFGEPAAQDGRTFLFDEMREIKRSTMSEIAKAAEQPATVELHDKGDIKVMSDGTRYQVTAQGWRRLAD